LIACRYCELSHDVDPAYPLHAADFDVGSDCPRCARHWRYVCQRCGQPSHFHGTFFCTHSEQLLCYRCATKRTETSTSFWAWAYHFSYDCPLCDGVHPALDYAEFAGHHPYQLHPGWEEERWQLWTEPSLPRRALPSPEVTSPELLTDADVGASWDAKAEAWDSGYDEEGDPNRKYQSDEVLFRLLGEVAGRRVLDAGCGQGYLCRSLARRGATVVGVENSIRFYELALAYQEREPLGIVYYQGSISDMPYLVDNSFDAIVSNYVLMDVRDYEGAVHEFARILKPGGVAVVVISHPCFHTPGSGWLRIPPDSLRREERARWMVDRYFSRGMWREHWGPFDTPFIGFHRTLTDYYHIFQSAGLRVTDLEEPSVTARGVAELPSYYVDHLKRIPYSIAFRLERRNAALGFSRSKQD
jgi:ubiquinone/menaquinone biosynthesis C-methylase UbiE